MSKSSYEVDGASFCSEREYQRRIETEMRHNPALTKDEAHKIVVSNAIDLSRSFKAMGEAHGHARSLGLGKGNGGTGQIPCSRCGTGTLHYSVSSFNGHMWGKCSTEGCLSWME